MKHIVCLCSALGFILTGCINVPKTVTALSKDHAFDSLHVRSIWANVDFTRDGRELNGNEITPDGGVKSIAPTHTSVIYVTNIVTREIQVPAANAVASPRARRMTNSVPVTK